MHRSSLPLSVNSGSVQNSAYVCPDLNLGVALLISLCRAFGLEGKHTFLPGRFSASQAVVPALKNNVWMRKESTV